MYLKLVSLIFLIIGISVSGCTTISKATSSDLEDPALNKNLTAVLVASESSSNVTLTSNSAGEIDYGTLDNLIAAVSTGEDIDKKKALAALMVKSSDEACYKFLTEISVTEKTTKSWLGASSVLLASAASLTTPVRNANLLSGLSAASQGVEDELSNSILGGQDGDILVQAVKSGRKKKRDELFLILEGKTITRNGVSTAGDFNKFIMEFPTYHDSCGIGYGRQVLRDAVTANDK